MLKSTCCCFQDLEDQLEEEESARQRLLLEKVTLETKVKSLEADLLTAVEQRDRFSKVSLNLCISVHIWFSEHGFQEKYA